jgi:hypothetical protein
VHFSLLQKTMAHSAAFIRCGVRHSAYFAFLRRLFAHRLFRDPLHI